MGSYHPMWSRKFWSTKYAIFDLALLWSASRDLQDMGITLQRCWPWLPAFKTVARQKNGKSVFSTLLNRVCKTVPRSLADFQTSQEAKWSSIRVTNGSAM